MAVKDAYHHTLPATTEPTAGPQGPVSLRGSVAVSMAGKAAEMVTLLLLATVVPRVLGAEDYGRFSVPLTVVTLGSLAMTLGGPTVMARYVPAAAPGERVAVARAIGARLARGRAAQVGVFAVAAAVAAVLAPDAFPPATVALVVVALGLNVAATLLLQIGLGLGQTTEWSLRFPLQNAVLIVAVIVLRGSAGSTGGAFAIAIAAIAGAAFGAMALRPVLRARPTPAAVPEGAIRFGALHAAGAALVQFSHRGGVLAVAISTWSSSETGFTALATGIALGVTYAVLQAFTVSLPHVAADADSGEGQLRRLAGWMLVALLPATVLATALLHELVPLVFGQGYQGATDAFVPALALMVLAPVNSLAVQSAALRLQPQVSALSGGASALTFATTALVMVPAWGAAGATTAALAGATASALVAMRLLPGAVGGRVATASLVGVLAVLTTAVLT